MFAYNFIGGLMKIISHKNITSDYNTFIISTVSNPVIDGVLFDILMTKDKRILIFTSSENYADSIENIQGTAYQNIKGFDTIPLEVVLPKFIKSNQKIILNLLPIISNPFANDTFQSINKLNEDYVFAVKSIVEKFPSINFYLCSAYDNLVYQIKRITPNKKIGFVINNLSTTYIDVDFYIFTVNILNEQIINQQLSLDKEVMIYITNCTDMNTIMKDNKKRSTLGTINIPSLNKVYFISNYPELFWKLFN